MFTPQKISTSGGGFFSPVRKSSKKSIAISPTISPVQSPPNTPVERSDAKEVLSVVANSVVNTSSPRQQHSPLKQSLTTTPQPFFSNKAKKERDEEVERLKVEQQLALEETALWKKRANDSKEELKRREKNHEKQLEQVKEELTEAKNKRDDYCMHLEAQLVTHLFLSLKLSMASQGIPFNNTRCVDDLIRSARRKDLFAKPTELTRFIEASLRK